MKVLFSIEGMGRSAGGPSSCTYYLVKALNEGGCYTDILTAASAPGDDFATDEFIRFQPNDKRTPLGISRNFSRYFAQKGTVYDVIHANGLWMWSTHQAARFARRYGKPLVISTHGMLYPQALKVSAWKKRLILPLFQRRDLRGAQVLHATCEAEYRHIRAFGLTNPVAIIPNALPAALLAEIDAAAGKNPEVNSLNLSTNNMEGTDVRLTFGFVGRLHPIKNIDLLLQAWALLGKAVDSHRLMIVGSGDAVYEAELKKFAAENCSGNVEFTGFLAGTELRKTVAGFDFQVLPSKSENFGMVVPEALAAGVPVIASKGTPWEILEEKRCGRWIESSVEALAAAIKEAISLSGQERAEMGRRGRRLVEERFLDTSVAAQFIELYRWLTGDAHKPAFVRDL